MNAVASDPVGVVGAGRLEQAMTRTALRADRSVVIANSRGPKSLSSIVSTLGKGVSAGTVDQAAAARIIIIMAVAWAECPTPCETSNGTTRSSSTRPTTRAPTT
jgi:predicted dinucleotide-binding enzyme